MSLTSHLADRGSPVREFFERRLGEPDSLRQLQRDFREAQPPTPRVPTPKGITARSGLLGVLGTAADYRLRVLLAPVSNPELERLPRQGADQYQQVLERRHGHAVATRFRDAAEAFFERLNEGLERGQQLGGDGGNWLARACLVLAWFDIAFRNPLVPLLFDEALPHPPADGYESLVPDDHAADVERLADLARVELYSALQPIRSVVVNPTFELSADVDGADGDLIVDRTLIDIKTTTKTPATLKRAWLWQLVGYALLDHSDHYGLHEVAVYLTRQATLMRWPLEELLCALAGREVSVSELREDFDRVLASSWPADQRPSRLGVFVSVSYMPPSPAD